MDNNEITMLMDVKLDIHNKRPDSLNFKQWTRCEVKIEAIKCLPCYLRVTITSSEECAASTSLSEEQEQARHLSVSIIVPGVNISYAASRTKQHSYGLFWLQNRKNCCIYFALETETTCRHHMKWIKKSIKNLELYRQLMLEQTRNSRGASMVGVAAAQENMRENWPPAQDVDYLQSTYSTLSPLPHIPDAQDGNQSAWSRRVSHTSQIYEEIFEGAEGPRLSRRISRTSIASGIYEEMKPCSSNFNAIDEEVSELQLAAQLQPPPLPPLPPPRKRINTFNGPGMLGEIPRSNTNPESELAKKKKYKNMLDNIFSSGRGKRAESVSETQACTAEDLINAVIPPPKYCKKEITPTPIYANETAVKRQNRKPKSATAIALNMTKRNSFSSPDLSKINYLDDQNDGEAPGVLQCSINYSEELDSNDGSLQDVSIAPPNVLQEQFLVAKPKLISTDSLNISQKISSNFNFSACNVSTINLIGANGAAKPPSSSTQKNKILIDDLTGYCVMAPIIKKPTKTEVANDTAPEPVSSGYSTGSYPSTSSSSAEEHLNQATTATPAALTNKAISSIADESTIYEKMHASLSSTAETTGGTIENEAKVATTDTNTTTDKEASTSASDANFTGNLYENLLAVKASQELEHQLPTATLNTSTPTESPRTQLNADVVAVVLPEEEESYYQTPRKSIISVDEKIPSYYPNSCDTAKTRRHYNTSPQKAIGATPATDVATGTTNEKSTSSASVGLRQLVTLKIRRERKENLYISSPQSIIDQRQSGIHNHNVINKSTSQKPSKTQKSLRAGAMKIAEHVYTVKHAAKVQKSNPASNYNNNNNVTDAAGFTDDMRERLQMELLQLAMLQKIDFKFDDTKVGVEQVADTIATAPSPLPKQAAAQQEDTTPHQHERIYENRLHKYKDGWLKMYGGASPTNAQVTTTTAAQQTSGSATCGSNSLSQPKLEMHHSCIGSTNVDSATTDPSSSNSNSCGAAAVTSSLSGVKKFASLPRFKKIDFSPLRLKINNVLQRGQQQDF